LLVVHEDDELAKGLINPTCKREGISRGQLTIHADNGGVMRSNTLYELFDKLGVQRSHSRPHCSNDNPYSESQFKTMKYNHSCPKRFSSINAARNFCKEFINEFNNHMYHSGIAMLTPAMVHHGNACWQMPIKSIPNASSKDFPSTNNCQIASGSTNLRKTQIRS